MLRNLPALAAAALFAAATPAAAIPGLVTGEAIGNVFVDFDENPDLAIAFAYPAFNLGYTSSGDVQEDGFDTGWVDTEYQEILIGMDVYAFAFSTPFSTAPVSSLTGIGRFADSVFATISNPTAFSQTVSFDLWSQTSLAFSVGGPFDRVSGQIGYTLRGRGDAAAIDFGAFGRIPPTLGDGPDLADTSADRFSFSLAPGGSYQLSIHDYVGRITLHASAVPEPAVWLQLIAGFAGVGVALRSRVVLQRARASASR